jgi:hypothetical protein
VLRSKTPLSEEATASHDAMVGLHAYFLGKYLGKRGFLSYHIPALRNIALCINVIQCPLQLYVVISTQSTTGIRLMKLGFGTFIGGRGHYPDIGQLCAFLRVHSSSNINT